MKLKIKHIIIPLFFSIFMVSQISLAEDQDLLGMTIEDILELDFSEQRTEGITIYGYMSTNVEKVFNELSVENGETVKTSAPHEWSLPHFNLFLRSPLANNIEIFINMASEGLEVRNMYGNIKLSSLLQLRLGKMYRRFGLFNEKLDEVPTYLGIEPPELFDGDHLLLPRLTTFMVHGEKVINNNTFSYALSTDNGEGGPIDGVVPLGWDARVKLGNRALVGLSGYFSSVGNGDIASPISVGDGSPEGGILPWMEVDKYSVFGGFAEVQVKNWLFKSAYWIANHDFTRDPASVLTVAQEAGINQRQKDRFFGENSSVATSALTVDDVVTSGSYKVSTGYIQVGYFINTNHGTFTPFAFFDWMDNPETIAKKTYGGDNEAGLSDDGKFYKWTAGIAYKPIDKVAVKLDTSTHIQKFNGKTETYPEVRFDISYLFK